YGESYRVPAPGGATSSAALGPCRSDHTSDDRLRAAHHVARHPRARPTRTPAAGHAGRAVTGHQRCCLTGGESRLYPRAGAVPTGGGDPPALPGPPWAAEVSSCAGRVAHGARAGGATPGLGPAGARPGLARGGIL